MEVICARFRFSILEYFEGGCKKIVKEVKDKRFCVMESNEVVRPRGLELFDLYYRLCVLDYLKSSPFVCVLFCKTVCDMCTVYSAITIYNGHTTTNSQPTSCTNPDSPHP